MNIASLFQVISMVSWLAVIAVFVAIVFQSSRNQPIKRGGTIIIAVVVVAIILSTVSAGLVFINPEERGVVISAISPKGYRDQALQPGLRWVIPFAESVITYPISKQTYTMSIAPSEGQIQGDDSIEARTSDGQKVLIDASVIYSVDPAEVVKIHIAWQKRYGSDLVRPQARGVIRDAVSQFAVQQVYSSKRDEMVDMVTKEMETKFTENGLILVDFVLRNISFSEEYAESVEQKQIAEQHAQQAEFVVQQRKQEAQQAREIAQGQADALVIEAEGKADARIIEAEAEAEALGMIAAALEGNKELLTYQYINQITPNVQVMFLPSDAPFIFPLPEIGPDVTTIPAPEPSPAP